MGEEGERLTIKTFNLNELTIAHFKVIETLW